MAVPVIDLTPFREGSAADQRAVAQTVGRACEDIGFLTLIGHGIAPDVVNGIDTTARQFFDLPTAKKLALKLLPTGVGYSPLQGETLAASLGQAAPADLKESLNLGPDFDENLWPAQPAAFKPAAIAYFNALTHLAATLMRVFALALDLPEHFFADKIQRHRSFLRLINYPHQDHDPLPGQLRAGAHTDYGTLTILRADNAPGGLQVRNRAGAWVTVEAAPESFVVNIGDLMMYWTNDRWISTLHRVVNPPRDKALGSRRQSLAFFHNPNPDALITCLDSCQGPGRPAKYPPITAGEHLALKTGKAYNVPPTA